MCFLVSRIMLASTKRVSYGRIQFFRAPWRRRDDRGPAHTFLIAVVSAIYLFIVGMSITKYVKLVKGMEKIVLHATLRKNEAIYALLVYT